MRLPSTAITYPILQRFDLLIFDLDGTLLQTAAEMQSAINDTLRAEGWPPVSQEDIESWVGHGTRELLVQALARVSRRSPQEIRIESGLASLQAAFDGHYARHCGTHSAPYPQVCETLAALKAVSLPLALVTNKDSAYSHSLLRAHGLAPLLDHVICGDQVPNKKPDPAGLQACMDHFGVTPARTLFVGDSAIDVETARRAGVTIWALPYGYNLGQPVQASQPDRLINDLSALLGDL